MSYHGWKQFGVVDANTNPHTLLELISVLQRRNAELTASNNQLVQLVGHIPLDQTEQSLVISQSNAATYGRLICRIDQIEKFE